MNLESKQLPYNKKESLIKEEDKEINKWQEFWFKIGSFLASGIGGHWEIKKTWRF